MGKYLRVFKIWIHPEQLNVPPAFSRASFRREGGGRALGPASPEAAPGQAVPALI